MICAEGSTKDYGVIRQKGTIFNYEYKNSLIYNENNIEDQQSFV
jgi:hypothetical protein